MCPARLRTWGRVALMCGLLGMAGGVACSEAPDFSCALDQDCVLDGTEGLCETNHYCSFPDPHCISGWAYGAHAPEDIAHTCVEEADQQEDSETATTP